MSAMSNLATDLEINWYETDNGYRRNDRSWAIVRHASPLISGVRLVTLYRRDPEVAGWRQELGAVELHTAVHHAMTKA